MKITLETTPEIDKAVIEALITASKRLGNKDAETLLIDRNASVFMTKR